MLNFRKRLLLSCILTIVTACISPAHATKAVPTSWIKNGTDREKKSDIFLSPDFTIIRGKFNALSEEEQPTVDTIDGQFLVGQLRYVHYKPYYDEDGILSDEIIVTRILDCKAGFYGTLKEVKKLKSKVVSEVTTPQAKIRLLQLTMPSEGSKLCKLHGIRNPQAKPNQNVLK